MERVEFQSPLEKIDNVKIRKESNKSDLVWCGIKLEIE